MKITACKFAFMFSIFACIKAMEIDAQSTFVRMYNKGNMGYAVREVPGNNYVVAGSTGFYYNWHWNIMSPTATTGIHLFKADANGLLQWERIFSKLNTRLIARWMEPTLDGGFILTGSANSDMVWPPDSNDVVLVKTNAAGIISWAKTFDSGKDDLGFCVQQTADGGFIISGFYDAMPVSLIGNTYILLIKTDGAGIVQWEKKYQFAVRDLNIHEAFSYVVKQTSNGGYIITGTIVGAHPADLNVLRTDAAGNVMWAKSFEHDASMWRNSLGIDVMETLAGDFVIAGSMDKDSPLHLNYPYFLKINSAGVVLKARFFETLPVLMFQSGFSSVQQTADGGFFFTGMGGYSDFGDQAQLLKTDANLDMQWSRVYTLDGLATIGSMSGRQTTDGGFVFTGKRQMSGAILMKTDAVGMVPCKNPGALIEYTPSVIVQNWAPVTTSGMVATNLLLTEQSPLIDTTTVCPVLVSHLPVELAYFAADELPGKKIQLQWGTASETNNNYFIVERSADNKTFTEVGKVNGAGNSNTVLNYNLMDEQPLPDAVSYYRLHQFDFNGENNFSKTVAVKFRNQQFEIMSAYADYESQLVKIIINHAGDNNAVCILTDAVGKTIAVNTHHVSNGASVITLDMKNFSKGIYVSAITIGSTTVLKRIVY